MFSQTPFFLLFSPTSLPLVIDLVPTDLIKEQHLEEVSKGMVRMRLLLNSDQAKKAKEKNLKAVLFLFFLVLIQF